MNVADFIIKFLAHHGVDSIFMVTGGQAMFLNDAVFRQDSIKPIFHHHEQSAGMAAEAYARIRGTLGVAMVTAGPGAINILNGVAGAWVDSAPMLVISGQSHLKSVDYMKKTKIRQHGLQGIFTEPVVSSVVKFFVTVDDPSKIKYYLEKALFIANEGRKGPVWLEVPIDIQRMEVPDNLQTSFESKNIDLDVIQIEKQVDKVISMLEKSGKPLFLAGQGIISADARKEFRQFIEKFSIPTITTRLGIDLIESDHSLFVGRPGLYGDRPANFAVQNADLIICIGARLDTGIVGYESADWGRKAKIIVLDIDEKELNKPGIRASLKIKADAKIFLRELNEKSNLVKTRDTQNWITRCNSWKDRYPMVLPEFRKQKLVNTYYFTEVLSQMSDSNDTIVVDTSSAFHVACQTWKVKRGQRFLTTGGISTMGYWVAAIGACIGQKKGRILAIAGDGSFQFNVQELATIKQNNLPIKIFVLNNEGYLLIRHTQKTHLGGRYMGEGPKTGLWCPNAADVANAYGIKGIKINNTKELKQKLTEAMTFKGPVVCDIKTPVWQLIFPRVASEKKTDGSFVSHPYEDMFPFLNREEFEKNMQSEQKSEAS